MFKRLRYDRLIKQYNRYLAKHERVPSKHAVSTKTNMELEYNKSLLMPVYDQAVVEDVARKKLAPKVINNLKTTKHKYGELKEKEYYFRLSVAEVMEDVCRINNWTSKDDLKKHKVELGKVFRDLFKAATEYCDVLKYYAKRRYDQRQTFVSKF